MRDTKSRGVRLGDVPKFGVRAHLRRVARVARAARAASHDATLAPVRVASSDAEIPPDPRRAPPPPRPRRRRVHRRGRRNLSARSVPAETGVRRIRRIHRICRRPSASSTRVDGSVPVDANADSVRGVREMFVGRLRLRASALAGGRRRVLSPALAASAGESDARASATAERSASVCPAFGRSHRDVRPRMDAARKIARGVGGVGDDAAFRRDREDRRRRGRNARRAIRARRRWRRAFPRVATSRWRVASRHHRQPPSSREARVSRRRLRGGPRGA